MPMGFRENLKSELAYADMPVKKLSAKSGINERTIGSYLRENAAMPSAEAEVSIAQALGVSVEYLVTGRDEFHDKVLAPLSPDIRVLVQTTGQLGIKDRNIVLTVARMLTNRSEESA
jgi:transcriptional regulator with XRE-family HTH domain